MKYVELTDGTYINLAQIVGFRMAGGILQIFDGSDNVIEIQINAVENYNKLRVASCN